MADKEGAVFVATHSSAPSLRRPLSATGRSPRLGGDQSLQSGAWPAMQSTSIAGRVLSASILIPWTRMAMTTGARPAQWPPD